MDSDHSPLQPSSLDCDRLTRAVPVYESFPGWERGTTKAKSFRDLPKNARTYLKCIEKTLGVPGVMISVGNDREKTILR